MKFLATFAVLAIQAYASPASSNCYCLPGDACWPSNSTWAQLNTTVGGRLIATVPIGSPCHDPNYNADQCAALQNQWTLPQLHLASSSSVMQAYFANQSCDPFTPQTQPCLLGNYVSYAVKVSSSADVIAAISFARKNKIRFVIRNTGHDFLGRSTGAGALSVWTQNLKDIKFLDWSDSSYKGRAVKIGAGVLGYEMVEAAAKEGLVVVTGTCPTVGAAGGYVQGGGHSAISTSFGLGADQTFEFEVVTASGNVVTASRTKNSDLYWALSGGGGGTYGVVLSVTVRAYPDAKVGGASLQLAAAGTTADKFYQAISAFHTMVPNITDSGASIAFVFNSQLFAISPITAFNQTSAQVKETLAPFIAVLNDLSIPFQVGYTDFASYRDHYDNFMGPLPYGHITAESYQFGSRLIPRRVLEENNDGLQAILRNITEHGVLAVSVALNVSRQADRPNAVLPAWRDAAIHMQLTTPWDSNAPWSTMVAAQLQMTNEFVPQVEAVTPGSGAYTNEADFRQPNFQQTFFGKNYNGLLAVKQKWDPSSLFYGIKTVGSEAWNVAADGRMCRA
ncbi:FAD/FMN-containing dehydrogenase [Zopfia rhizophila CBS 207.26]|uniref:FAD/FMN-containing dehydrogenase n=1 Tax=Zopfia rhizophila CBS 207.26 TaxID=1314779 RepID=A0A6A6EC85_9PEZI|nr:FAD/FMN-containing dehydrogenase [Zopfia rhizophila CBS 207.26]